MNFFNWNNIGFKEVRGIKYKTVLGKNMQMFCFKLDPGQTSSYHQHSEEQMGYILAGEGELTIGTETKICKAGEAYYIPANTHHGFKALDPIGLEWVEVFSPPKKEHSTL